MDGSTLLLRQMTAITYGLHDTEFRANILREIKFVLMNQNHHREKRVGRLKQKFNQVDAAQRLKGQRLERGEGEEVGMHIE